MKNAPFNNVKAVVCGIEGELIFTEHLHYEKWRDVALQQGVVKDETRFQTLWRDELAGIGDKAIYSVLAQKHHQHNPTAPFLAWDKCQAQIDASYQRNLHRAEVPEGLAEAINRAQEKGVHFVIVTHATKELAEKQIEFMKSKGVHLDNAPILFERKDGGAYQSALNLLRESAPNLKAKDVLVLDATPKYIQKAQSLGMRTAHIEQGGLPDHLQQLSVVKSVKWENLTKALTVCMAVGIQIGNALTHALH